MELGKPLTFIAEHLKPGGWAALAEVVMTKTVEPTPPVAASIQYYPEVEIPDYGE